MKVVGIARYEILFERGDGKGVKFEGHPPIGLKVWYIVRKGGWWVIMQPPQVLGLDKIRSPGIYTKKVYVDKVRKIEREREKYERENIHRL